jgi:hyaluronate lyase
MFSIKVNLRTLIGLGVLLSLVLNILLPTKPAIAGDNYDNLRVKWHTMLTGGENYAISSTTGLAVDTDIRNRIGAITGAANTYSSTLNRQPNRTYLWNDADSTNDPADITTSYSRLRGMALAYATRGSTLYQNAQLRDTIVAALDWLDTYRYNDVNPPGLALGYGNWWDWEIGVPLALNDTVVLLYDALKATPGGSQKITNYMAAINRFSPDPTRTIASPNVTGANRAWKIIIVGVRGAIVKDGQKIELARNALSQLFDYVTTGDGFYTDGSFIQHNRFPYNGGYGSSLLGKLADVVYWLQGSSWPVVDPDQTNIYQWIYNAYEPLIYRGAMMDMVRGREIARQDSQDQSVGRSVIRSIIRVSQFAPSADKNRLQSMAKYWLQINTTLSLYGGASVDLIIVIKQLMSDNNIAPRGELVLSKYYPAMDRAVHLRPGWGLGLSMYSNRIYNYEAINSENLKGWYTAEGMLYLYNSHLNHYSDNFWATVNPYRLPGTTVDTLTRTAQTINNGYKSSKSWVGGVTLNGLWGISGMELAASGDLNSAAQVVVTSSLTARKSRFMFDDEVVALGAAINASDQSGNGWDGTPRKVETVVENRRLISPTNTILTVNGTAQPGNNGWSANLTNVNSMHLAGAQADAGDDIGYYFPGGTTVNALREQRSGSWYDINQKTGSTTPFTNTYLTFWLNHGSNPANQTYSYTLLPGKTATQVTTYSANPDITILANDATVQAVKESKLGLIGANFWTDATVTLKDNNTPFLTVNKKAATLTRYSNTELEIAISDPTQLLTGTIEVEINRAANNVITLDSGITVQRLYPTIRLSVNVTGSRGRTFAAKFKLGTSLIVTSPTDNGQANVAGTLSQAIQQANTGAVKAIIFDLAPNNSIILQGGTLPALGAGVSLYGLCGENGPGVLLNGNGLTGPGLKLSGGVIVQGIHIKGFSGPQILLGSGGNKLDCVRSSAT